MNVCNRLDVGFKGENEKIEGNERDSSRIDFGSNFLPNDQTW